MDEVEKARRSWIQDGCNLKEHLQQVAETYREVARGNLVHYQLEGWSIAFPTLALSKADVAAVVFIHSVRVMPHQYFRYSAVHNPHDIATMLQTA